MTADDIDKLNTRVVGQNGVTIPRMTADDDTCYACPYNKQRNAASNGIFRQHIFDFPSVESDALPPDHTIIIEAEIESTKSSKNNNGMTRVSRELRDRIVSTCGDAHVRNGSAKKIDPCLHLYVGAHAMCIDNSKLKETNLGNSTLC